VFCVELQLGEALLENGEWIKIPCPRCGSEWSKVKAGKRTPGGARPPARRKQVAAPPEEKPTALTPSRILSLRKKLGLKGQF
jgi:hypothetical protein